MRFGRNINRRIDDEMGDRLMTHGQRASLSLLATVLACRSPAPATEPARPAVAAAPVAPAPSAPAVAPRPAPVEIAAEPPAAGDIGTAGFVWTRATAPGGEWVLLCQARKDTDRNGTIEVQYGMHGEVYGDELAPYWIRGAGAGEELDAVVAVDPARNYLVVIHGKAMELLDTRTAARVPLRGADTRYIEAGLFDGDRAAFAGEYLLYLRVPATKKGRRTIVVRRLADGDEREVDPGKGTLRLARMSGQWILAAVYDPTPGYAVGISSHSSGPDHTEGGRRCRGDRTDGGRLQLSGTDRRWAPLTGGEAASRRDVLTSLGADLITRAADGALAIEHAGAAVELAPASCGGLVVARSEADGSVLVACKGSGDPAELRLWHGGAVRTLAVKIANPTPDEGIMSDLERTEHEGRDEAGGRRAAIATPDGRMVLDLVTGRMQPAVEQEAVAAHDDILLLHRREGPFSIYDRATGAVVELPGVPPDMMDEAQQGRLFAAGPRADDPAPRPGMLVDLAAAVVLGTFTGPALAVSTTGWVLSPAPAAGAASRSDGPLRWVRPTPP
jgi:hypothetical protein